MAATSPQTLFAESACFCAVTSNAYETMKLALLSSIVQSLGITMTIPELIDYGKCYACLGLSTAQTAELALLDLIFVNGGGGGGGGGGGLSGAGSPTGSVTPTAVNQWYRDTSTNNFYWSTGLTNNSWYLVI